MPHHVSSRKQQGKENAPFARLEIGQTSNAGRKCSDNTGLKLSMITNSIRIKIADASIYDYLAKNPNLIDTGSIWYPITLAKFSEDERNRFISNKYKQQIRGIESYLVYANKFPADKSLDSLKTNALDYSLNNSNSFGQLMEYAKLYPEIENKAKVIAKKKCTSTTWSLNYINYFPNDSAKDSIINIAFIKAKDDYDYEKLLHTFPSDARTGEFEFKIAVLAVTNKRDFSSYDMDRLETRFASHPNILNYFNTLRLMNNIKLEKNNFYNLSYVLSESGKVKINQFVQLIQLINADKRLVKDVYLVLNCDSAYRSEKSDLINFKLGVKTCPGLQFKILFFPP